MKAIFTSLLFGLSLIHVLAQDTTLVLNTNMFESIQHINLASQGGWIYHEGNNLAWARQDIHATKLKRLTPADSR